MRHSIVVTATGLVLALGMTVIAAQTTAVETVGFGPALQEALQGAGWDVESLADGSVELRRVPTPPEDELAGDTDTARDEPAAEVAESVAWDRLRESGWRVEKAADGSTLLYPPATEVGATAAATTDIEAAETTSAKSFDDYLRERGWRVERAADGSLLLYPRISQPRPVQPRAAANAVVEPCPGVLLAPVLNGEIELPIDRGRQARAIAESWVKSVATPGLLVGKIRRFSRVFVVKIMDVNPPHRLRHQIAISSDDGRVIVLN